MIEPCVVGEITTVFVPCADPQALFMAVSVFVPWLDHDTRTVPPDVPPLAVPPPSDHVQPLGAGVQPVAVAGKSRAWFTNPLPGPPIVIWIGAVIVTVFVPWADPQALFVTVNVFVPAVGHDTVTEDPLVAPEAVPPDNDQAQPEAAGVHPVAVAVKPSDCPVVPTVGPLITILVDG